MATSVYTHELVEKTAAWRLDRNPLGVRELERYVKINQAIHLSRGAQDVEFCALISADASYLAAVESRPSQCTIICTMYHLSAGFKRVWSSRYIAPRETFESKGTAKFCGGPTRDGQAVLLIYRSTHYGRTNVYLINHAGFTTRTPPGDLVKDYVPPNGVLSDDGEHIFFIRSGHAKKRQTQVVDVYSIRHLSLVRTVNFTFGDGSTIRNSRFLRPLLAQRPIHIGVETGGFSGDDDVAKRSPALIASSDRKIHWNFAKVEYISGEGGKNTFISDDGSHMCHLEKDTAMLHYWDLRNLSLEPMGSVRLPGVEFSQRRRWLIHGQETIINDSIPHQLHHVRYSSGGKVVTVVTVNNETIVINVLLTFTLQLIYNQVVRDPEWIELVPLSIGFSEPAGLNVFAMCPTTATVSTDGIHETVRLLGVLGILFSSQDIYSTVRRIEDYFDFTSDRLAESIRSGGDSSTLLLYRFRWLREDVRVILDRGQPPSATQEDKRRQQTFYERIFMDRASGGFESRPDLHQRLVPFLFSFAYPWDAERRVSVFAVLMKHEYHIIAIGPPVLDSGVETIRALYATDIQVGSDPAEMIEIYKINSNYILHVFVESGNSVGSYSGAPMPRPIWTIISPHFLEEDAWYDLFVIHRSHSVTLINGMISTPNTALIYTANFYAYLTPRTIVDQDEIEYGHRAHPIYTAPKYLLWSNYGLRGFREDKMSDILFGGGQFADYLGRCFRSVYDDKTYDDSSPLFSSTFALTCFAGHRSQKTRFIDAFFRRMHQDPKLLLSNCRAISRTLPVACAVRPMAALSFMRDIVLFQFRVVDVGPVNVQKGRFQSKESPRYGKMYDLRRLIEHIGAAALSPWVDPGEASLGPNVSHVTVPLPSFCSFQSKLYKQPPITYQRSGNPLWDFVTAAWETRIRPTADLFYPTERWLLHATERTGKTVASPFTRTVEEILDIKDKDVQLSFLRVVWFEKLLAWKLQTFGRRVFLTRVALPMLVLFSVHLTLGVLMTQPAYTVVRKVNVPVLVLACIEAVVSIFILVIKSRQLRRVPRRFLRSIFNYIDGAALSLAFTMVIIVFAGKIPPRSFLGFSTLLIWVAAILMLRVYKAAGMLLILITETIQGVFPFLALLSFIILGFAFVPFLLLRNQEGNISDPNPFSSFPRTISQLLNFASSDYGSLEPFESESAAVRTLRALYIIVITILLLNTLIAMLNLKIKRADKHAANLCHRQMASLQVDIELCILTARERARLDWFPEWFSYTMTETEKHTWDGFLKNNPLEWTEKNDFGEDKDNTPNPPREKQPAQRQGTVDAQDVDDSSRGSGKSEEPVPPPAEDETRTADKPVTVQDASSSSATMPPPNHGDTSNHIDAAAESSEPAEATTGPDDNSSALCKVCGQPGRLCVGCRMVAYCTKEHQRIDWATHKAICKGKAPVRGI